MLDGFSDPFQFSIVLLCVPTKCSPVLLSRSGRSQPGWGSLWCAAHWEEKERERGKMRAGKRQQYWKWHCQELHLMWGEQGPAPPPHWSVALSMIYVLCIIKGNGLFWKFLEAKKFHYFILFERGSHYVAPAGSLILLHSRIAGVQHHIPFQKF